MFLQSLIEDYSGRGISNETDRPIAIQGLMDRIANALPSKIHHGIIQWYLHRTLLWRRIGAQNRRRIEYRSNRSIPTWSWMAYPDRISFVADDCKWEDMEVVKDINFGTIELRAIVWKFAGSDVTIGPSDGDANAQLLDVKGSEKGWISLDTEVELLSVPDVVVLARRSSPEYGFQYFVLFVEQQESGNYERCGVGMIRENCTLASLGHQGIC
jgi:hypothetical protein